ncbi:hypothetical protein FHX64_000474 [Microbacter margulisiae]|uniref:Uncharacterized protein n=1 Tax=Microbacter margulisiae TaxID=1350067 RepID=A0A7W5DNV8_9PORP|nr:hypothetical protein [Microbacter margulisiae]
MAGVILIHLPGWPEVPVYEHWQLFRLISICKAYHFQSLRSAFVFSNLPGFGILINSGNGNSDTFMELTAADTAPE